VKAYVKKLIDRFQQQSLVTSVPGHFDPHREFVIFLYSVLFGRQPEDGAVEHWNGFLSQGLSYEALFESLWRSDEFKDKVPNNLFFKAPPHIVHETQPNALITDQYLSEIIELVKADPLSLLEIASVRSWLAARRYHDLKAQSGIDRLDESEFVVPHTIEYNERTLESYVALDRSAAMILPLLSIGRVAENVAKLRVLSIGPRTEIELFALLAAGFRLENIELIDLFSYSPYFKLGDMHDLPYGDDSFDVIILGFVLAYSTRPEIAVKEVVRVAKDRAIISIGYGRHEESSRPTESARSRRDSLELRVTHSVQTTVDLLNFFGPNVGSIYFKCEAEKPYSQFTNRILAIFELAKNRDMQPEPYP
jgi:SAM-dependent methyltransferase